MKILRFTDSQIMAILKQNEAGDSVPDLGCERGISSASVYKWRAKFGGMDALLMKRMRELEDENRRLKKMYAERRLKAEIAKDIIAKSGEASSVTRTFLQSNIRGSKATLWHGSSPLLGTGS